MHVVLFGSGKGGVGKSTLAANVAYALATRIRTLLMDFSAFDKTSTSMLVPGCVSKFGIYDYLFYFREAMGVVPEIETCERRDVLLEVLPPGSMEEAVQTLSYSVLAKRVKTLMDMMIKHFSIVIVDYPGRPIHTDPLLQAVMSHVDHLIIVLEPTEASVSEARALYNFATQRCDPPPIVSSIINKYAGEKITMELRSAGGFVEKVPLMGEVMALGRNPHLQYSLVKPFQRVIDNIAAKILNVRLQVRHTYRQLI